MQRERAGLGSFSESLNCEHGSTSSNASRDQQIRWENIHNIGDNGYMSSSADANTSFANSVYHEQRGLHRFRLGEASSSHGEQRMRMAHFEERNPELNPLFMQPSSGNRVVRNVNLNAEYNEQLEDVNPATGHPRLSEFSGLESRHLPENSVRAGSFVDGRRASCKRKALDDSIGQSSSSRGFHEVHRGESSSWVPGPSFYTPANDLNISGTVPNLSGPSIAESSSRNFSARANPSVQQETVRPAVFSAGSVIGRPVAPSVSVPGHLPADQHLIDLRHRHTLGNFAPQNPNASAATVSRNMIPPSFQWSGNPVAAGGSSSSAAPVDRNVIDRGETRQRSNTLETPLFAPAPEVRNLAHGHVSRNASGAGHVASSSSSRTSVQPSPPSPTWTLYQGYPELNRRILAEAQRWLLLSSLAESQRTARSLVHPASPNEHLLQSNSGNTAQARNRAYPRASPRQGQTANGVPHSLRGLASTSRGRSRVSASEVRNVLDYMRRRRNLRSEPMVQGLTDVHDRYRGMELDVDNMSYEELLSLEERIGDVCTGLHEETISNRLKQHKYNSSTIPKQEVEPCCICQEEYNEGEEMGVLECGHEFHSQCIKEWLKRKNLCPICKRTGLNTAEKPRRR